MTSNDRNVPTQEKALSVALSAIMVLSVIAIGMAGFAGTSAALADPVENPDPGANEEQTIFADPGGSVVANNSTSGANSTHTITVSPRSGSSLDDLSASDTDQLRLNVSYASGFDVGGLSGNDIQLFINDGEVDVPAGNVSIGPNGRSLNITTENGTGDSQLSNFDAAPSDNVTVVLGSDLVENGDGLSNVSVQAFTSTTTSNTFDQTATGQQVNLPLTLPGPIELQDSSGNTVSRFTQIGDAVDAASPGQAVIVGDGEFRELNNTVDITSDNIAIQAASGASPVLNLSGSSNPEADIVANNVAIDSLAFEGNTDGSSAIIDSGAPRNATVSNNEFVNFSNTVIDLQNIADDGTDAATAEISDNSINASATAIDIDSSAYTNLGSTVDITSNNIVISGGNNGIVFSDADDNATISSNVIDLSGGGIAIDLDGQTTLNLTVSGDEIDGNNGGTGVQTSSINAELNNLNVNATNTGVDIQSGDQNVNVTGGTFTNIGTDAIDIQGNVADSIFVENIAVDSSLNGDGIQQATAGPLNVTNSQFTDVDNGIIFDGAAGGNAIITDTTFTNATNGLDVTDAGDTFNATANFNTFEDGSTGVIIDDSGAYNISLTFNDFINNSNNGLEVGGNYDTPGAVNAKYSFWGDSTGPSGTNQTSSDGLDAFGSGDNVTIANQDDADAFPFLQESTTAFTDQERAGDVGVIIEAPAFPRTGEVRTDVDTNTTVTVLNASAGVSASDIDGANVVGDGATVETAPNDASGTLSPNNVATFNLSASQKGSFQTEVFISGINNPTEDQKFTGRLDSTSVTVNDSTIAAGEDVSVSVQAIDAGGQDTERQNLSVTFSNSGFPDADLQFTDQEAATDNTGEATALIRSGGSINPGETVDISARVGGTSFQTVSVTTAAGAPDAENSTLTVGGNANDKTEQVNSTLSVSARINDTDANNLEGQTVEFSSNESVSFEATNASVDTNANGFANTTVTLPNSTDIGTVAINATVGNFNPGNTGSASVNVTTEAAAPTQLGFATDSRSLAPSATRDVTVQVEDEFGNQNTSAGVNSGIAVSSSDTSVLSVSGVNDLGGNNNATFTLTGESAGEATINVTSDDSNIGAVEDTFTVAGADAIELSVAHNVATESASNANANTRNQALLTAQFVDSSGEALGISNRNVSFALSGQAAELNQSDNTVKTTDSDGNVTILVNGTDTTGTSDVIATDANVSGVTRGEATVTTTGGATTIDVAPTNDTITQGESINVTTEFIDNEGRNVPRIASVSLSASGGTVPTGSTTTAPNADGAVVSTFSYNSSGANGSVTLTASGDGLFGDTTITVETVEPDAVQIDNVNLDPNSVTTNTTNDHDLTFDALNVSADNSTDSFAVEIPSAATLESANDVTVTTENVSAQNLAVDGNNITFDVNPDSESTTIDLSVEANVTVSVPNVSQETTADLTIDATDSDGTSDNASATLTITVEDGQPGDDGEQSTAEIEFGDDRTVPNRTSTVEVESATFNGSRDFVIVVHQTSPGANDFVDNTSEIGGKIGSSDVLTSNTVSNEPVNLNKTLDNNVTELTQNQTLVAMLHFANESRPGDRNFDTSIKRNETPVFDQTNVTVSPLEGAPGEADDDGNGEVETNELIDTTQQFGTGELSVDELLEVIDAFTS